MVKDEQIQLAKLQFKTHGWVVTLVILAVAFTHLQTRVALNNVCGIVKWTFRPYFKIIMVIIRQNMDLFLFIVLKMLWMGLGSWALQMIFCRPAAATTRRGDLFPQSQSSPSGFSSPPRSRCSRVLDVNINNYKAMNQELSARPINFPLSLPLSSACHAGYQELFLLGRL